MIYHTIMSESDPVVENLLTPAASEPDPAPASEPAPDPTEEASEAEVPLTQEVVQNVPEMLSSTDTSGSVNELENRVKVLEERLEKLIGVLEDSWLFDPNAINNISHPNHIDMIKSLR